ncbi:hypothetical protein FLK61_31825 [Paenalkalicoccus suaedae]|uniref:Core domain-containing protein n=1 Tax=Paenalkalicoccus suaedae TaxID=2592382 RepID=A0A859FEK1_9BACI|nr:iron-sulfur cluster biosynthesis family protein [Paenalkalicoccus suaedae]QKS71300.1 hypothetical protein FLK61_31825 [Paenalkalicoccus suaedae]
MELTLHISEKAHAFYREEMGLTKGEELTFFVRVGGVGSGGFSVGLTRGKPVKASTAIEVEGVSYYVMEDDYWYLHGMTIDYDEDRSEVTFTHESFSDTFNPNEER